MSTPEAVVSSGGHARGWPAGKEAEVGAELRRIDPLPGEAESAVVACKPADCRAGGLGRGGANPPLVVVRRALQSSLRGDDVSGIDVERANPPIPELGLDPARDSPE